jgi:archaellum component FlaC
MLEKYKSFMKNLIVCALVVMALVNACNVKDSEEYRGLARENDSLIVQIKNREQQLEAIAVSMDEIERNLAEIEKNELAIGELKKEGQLQQKDRINEMIRGIDTYIDANKEKLVELERKVNNSSSGNTANLQKIVAQLKKTVREKEMQISQLRTTISVLEGEKDSLTITLASRDTELLGKNIELTSRQRTIEEKEANLTTAYFMIGNRKQLVDEGVIKKEGGVLGVGRTLTLADHLNPGNFRKINIKNVREIELGDTKKRNVVSSHPADSYFFANSNGKVYLTISDYQKFWSVSKFLVVEIDS